MKMIWFLWGQLPSAVRLASTVRVGRTLLSDKLDDNHAPLGRRGRPPLHVTIIATRYLCLVRVHHRQQRGRHQHTP